MQKVAIIFLPILFFVIETSAQNQDSVAIRRYYEENAILWLGENIFYKGDKKLTLKEMEATMAISRSALADFRQYKKSKTWTAVTLTASLGLLVGGAFVKERRTQNYMLAGSMVMATVSIPLARKSQRYLGRSIWTYNRDILLC